MTNSPAVRRHVANAAICGLSILMAVSGAGSGVAAAATDLIGPESPRAARPPAFSPEPIGSYLVTVAAPSVHDAYADLLKHQVDPTSHDVAGNAATLAPHLARAEMAANAAQQPVIAFAARLGADVISSYTAAANGLLVHATAKQAQALAQAPGVSRVEPAPRMRLTLGHSVPYIGGTTVSNTLGFDGAGTVIAVADTGIDYTHADFGGPGTVEAFQVASAGAQTITDQFAGAPLFPTAKVVGGWDFVGPRYNPPWLCSPGQEASGECTTTPEPDPDPLDGWGHGTHVAGISAGQGTVTGSVAPGVAPGASLVALKVYSHRGRVDEEIDVAVDAIEWCTRVNLGLAVPGTPPPSGHVDVINMSFGESFGQGALLYDEAAAAAADVGITVVAAAGNDSDIPFVAGAPGASRAVLSVASSSPPTDAYGLVFSWSDGAIEPLGSEGTSTKPLRETGRIQGELAWMGTGCPGAPVNESVAGKVALVDRADCSAEEKIAAAEAAGALAIIVYTDNRPRRGLSDGSPAGIAGVMIDNGPGQHLKSLREVMTRVTTVLDPAVVRVDVAEADVISSFSSRGPGKHGTLKPDLTAPGSGIVSAAMGGGDAGRGLGGTSMASPHVAGAAALLRQRARVEGLNLDGADLSAILMNTALPVVTDNPAGRILEVSRQGAGRVDLVRAATAPLVVRAGDIASLRVGPVALTATALVGATSVYPFTMTVTNTSDAAVRLRAVPHFRNPAGAAALAFELPVPLEVDADTERTFPLHLDVDAEALPPWPFGGSAGIGAAAAGGVELDGWLELEQINAANELIPGTVNPHLPFYVLARRAAAVTSAGPPPLTWTPEPPGIPHVEFTNPSAFAGTAELYWHVGEDVEEPEVLRELDIRHVGARYIEGVGGITDTILSLAVTLWEPMTVPYGTQMEIFVSTDDDGRSDHVIKTMANAAGNPTAFVVAVAAWDPVAGVALGEQVVGPYLVDVHTRVLRIEVPIRVMGMSEPRSIGLAVHHGAAKGAANDFEDWLNILAEDWAPDEDLADPFFHFDPAAVPWRLDDAGGTVPGKGTLRLPLAATAVGDGVAMLGVFPQNDPYPPDAQARVLPSDVTPGAKLYLPVVLKDYELRPPSPDQVVRAGLDALAATSRFRLTYDVFNTDDEAQSALREYMFDGDRATQVVTRPKAGRDVEQVRYNERAYIHEVGEPWRCGAIDPYLFSRPELIARLRSRFPTTGWEADGRAANDPSLLQFRWRGFGPSLAQVPEAGGPIVVLSNTLGDIGAPFERQVYRFRAFDDQTIKVLPPDGVACD